jgi:hypothetical protein
VISQHDDTEIPFTRETVARFTEGAEPMQRQARRRARPTVAAPAEFLN